MIGSTDSLAKKKKGTKFNFALGYLMHRKIPGNMELKTARIIVLLLKGWLVSGLKTGIQRRTRMK